MTLQELEEKILKEPLLKFDEGESIIVHSWRVKEFTRFLAGFFAVLNHKFNTIEVESGKLQTNVSKNRSLGDIYNICRFYFKTLTFEQFLTSLEILKNERLIGAIFCPTLRKRIYISKTEFYGRGWGDNLEGKKSFATDDYIYKDEYGLLPDELFGLLKKEHTS